MSVFFKCKTGTSYSLPQSLGDVSCRFLSCDTVGTNWDADPQIVPLWIQNSIEITEILGPSPRTAPKGSSECFVLSAALQPAVRSPRAAGSDRACGRAGRHPDCAHQRGAGKALPGKQTRLFCSFHSTAICWRQGRSRAELHPGPV